MQFVAYMGGTENEVGGKEGSGILYGNSNVLIFLLKHHCRIKMYFPTMYISLQDGFLSAGLRDRRSDSIAHINVCTRNSKSEMKVRCGQLQRRKCAPL